ncbi:MAG TPA: FtsX-like permease family protein [Streptosporangiales bacterium]
MTLTAAWLRLELRRRWWSLVVLALLVAFATATVLAAVAGARRGDSAVERLMSRTLPATAVVLPNQPGFDWDRIRALPEVESVGTFVVAGFRVDGISDYDVGFPLADDETMRTVERPVVVRGRALDPHRLDEVVVSARFPEYHHKDVGDAVTIRLPSPTEMDAMQTGGTLPARLHGPVIHARIVGVVRSAWFSDTVGSTGSLQGSPALFTRYPRNLLGTKNETYVNALVRLRGGEAALPEFRRDLARVTGRSDIDVWNSYDMARHQQNVDAFEAACLLAFGLAALGAAIALVGQSVARYTAATVVDLRTLRAVGLTPREATAAASVAPTLAASAGATLGVAGAVAASAWLPIGAAATVEPAPGLDADWLVLVPGWLLVPLAVFGAAAAAAWFAFAAMARDRPSPRRSAVALTAARAGLPVPVSTGVRFALEPGRGRAAVPVRPALFGAVVGVLGVLAAFTFSAGVADAAANPARFGQTHQIDTFLGLNGQDLVPSAQVLDALAGDRDVASVNNARVAVTTAGEVSVTLYTYAPLGRPLPTVLNTGRMPAAADEIVLASTSARKLHAGVGSTVRFTGNRGARQLRVVGVGFVPNGSHNNYDEGGWVTPAAYDRLFTGFKFHQAEIALRPGADVDAVVTRLQHATAAVTHGRPVPLEAVQPPTQVAELRDVEVLPTVLAAFLALLAIGAVGHALATAVRRRRYEMAVMRALGLTRTQSRLVVVTQATVLAVVGLLFGVPLGLALGRTLWRLVAANTPLYYQPPLALLALLLAVPAALVVANVLAALPGHRAARLRIGHILRAE